MHQYISETEKWDQRLIEAGFPCHQVGAETQRERGASSALPPLYYLHVWWARRPLTPSRAAILASLLPAETDPDWFLRQLGIEKVQALVNGVPWTLDQTLAEYIRVNNRSAGYLPVDERVLRELRIEQQRRNDNQRLIARLCQLDADMENHETIGRWVKDSLNLPEPLPKVGDQLPVQRVAAEPAWFKELMQIASSAGIRVPNLYGYERAYTHQAEWQLHKVTILDPTAGGGSIPFEALRLGCNVIANELNPVASIILYSTLEYPTQFGPMLCDDIEEWGTKLLERLDRGLDSIFPRIFHLPPSEQLVLERESHGQEILINKYNSEDTTTFIYCRQVTCPHCGGEAPLLNSSWLAKDKERWGVRLVPDGKKQGGTVSFETYRIKGGKGPGGEDPNLRTVNKGVGACVHCKQAISAEEIKAQARGESPHGRWQDRLYCVVAVRHQPLLDKNGQARVYKSGKRKGEIRTKKIRFFRPPNGRDLEALEKAAEQLGERWEAWEKAGLIPTESIPEGNDMRPVIYGMNRWCDLFTPRQLLGHLILVEELNRLKPQILQELGDERGRAVVTYLQFMIDKGLDYNSKQTRWEYTRGVVKGTFGRHDFSLKWTFGEMIFSGPNSGAAWALRQVVEAYRGIAELLAPLHDGLKGAPPPLRLLCGTAAHMDIPDRSVDLICIDPPYYNNVQYAELSDYFYVWQRRTLGDLYPECMGRRLTNKKDEAVANPARDGSAAEAAQEYQRLMAEIFAECRRVLKDDDLMTLMFTHKTMEAWEALTLSLIESGWIITGAMPVESEAAESMHQKGMAAAASSVFLSCRKRPERAASSPALWGGFGDAGVAEKVRQAVRQGLQEFSRLALNPVDEMVAAYGRALRVFSEHWPVLDGDDFVSPTRAMAEAGAVAVQHQFSRLTGGRLNTESLNPETAAALIFYGIFGLGYFSYDQALNLSRALNIRLESKAAGYRVEGRVIGANETHRSRRGRAVENGDLLYHAPVIRAGAKLRLALPEERHHLRLENPRTEWDILQGLIVAYRKGDAPLARDYLEIHAAGQKEIILDLLEVWSSEAGDRALRREGESILFSLR